MTSRDTPRLGVGFAAMAALAGALLHASKGAVLLISRADLSLVPSMITLFALGLVGFGVSLGARGGSARRIAIAASLIAVIAGVVSLAYQAGGIAPEHTDAPAGVAVAYGAGTLGVFIALIALGVGVLREATLPMPWRVVPLVVGIVWFPLEGLTAVLPDGWGLPLAGVSWMPIAYCIWLARRAWLQDPERRAVDHL